MRTPDTNVLRRSFGFFRQRLRTIRQRNNATPAKEFHDLMPRLTERHGRPLKDWHAFPCLECRYSPLAKPSDKSSLRTWLRDHDRLMTILGALIIFATFLLRDWYAESLKDIKDSVDTAQATFVLQRENRTIQERLSWIFSLTSVTYTNVLTVPRPNPGKITLVAEEVQYQFTFDSINRMRDQLDALDRLFAHVPHSRGDDQKLTSLRSRYIALSLQYRSYIQPGSSTPQPELESAFNTIVQLKLTALSIENDLDNFSSAFLAYGQTVLAKDEASLDKARRWSHALYALGWSLALFGKLFGDSRRDDDAVEA
jgi:hypothetical protein